MLNIVMIILCGLAIYHHAIFPLILKRMKPKVRALNSQPKSWPKVTLIVPAYNEEKSIAEKIINTACLDYPKDKLELIIACDGCSDQTAEKALQTLELAEVTNLNANILNFQTNRGKVATLNDAIAQSTSEIVALSDCSASLSIDAIKRVSRHFENKGTGVVGGTYQLSEPQNTAEQTYWAYQRTVKKGEAALGSPMGMHGAFYAFRKSLSAPLSPNTINDDFILPMKIVAKGYRAIYDEKIISVESEATTTQMNWKRRLRISAGNLQQALYCIELLDIRRPGIAFAFFSGKFLRAWMGLILLAIFAVSAYGALIDPTYLIFLGAQMAGLLMISLPVPTQGKFSKMILTLRYIVVGHLAGLIGSLRYLSGLEKGAWKRASQ